MTDQPMTYAGSGVSYDAMDPFKRACQLAGLGTAGNIQRLANREFKEWEASRGESAYLIEAADSYLAHVEEGLGTKNLVADAMYALTGKSYYDQVAQDTVAMIVNDMITLGALPLSVAMHLAVGDSAWFDDEQRWNDLIKGWATACTLARCVWGGGETPTLKDVVIPGAVVLSGSAMGIVKPKERLIRSNIQHGDAIVMLASSGVHANGLTLARKIAERTGYHTRLSDGRMFGEALLDPTAIYVPVVEDCQEAGIDLHYTVNVTGHGWRKLMRAVEPFVYWVNWVPEPQPVFSFIQEHGPVDAEEMYGNYNMGAGFALYVAYEDAERVVEVASQSGIQGWIAGHIAKTGDKRVVIQPLDLSYEGETLGVR
ncbi:phosphoribosylformylglycinamidine cyclo-ligase [Candidatus Saccharibacteria bacterium]|nr:phosphoribosylformylglycinamidine cyclo-ligase [Candidatus Saccharibacteria bacterium]